MFLLISNPSLDGTRSNVVFLLRLMKHEPYNTMRPLDGTSHSTANARAQCWWRLASA